MTSLSFNWYMGMIIGKIEVLHNSGRKMSKLWQENNTLKGDEIIAPEKAK